MKKKIIIDCDPGHDDAIAIMLAGKNPNIDLLGISVVAGNQTLDKTLRNTLNICQYLEINVPVYSGCDRPMIKDKQVIADDIHGATGLDGPVFPNLTKKAEQKHAVSFLVDTLCSSDTPITLVPTGPLTNIAMAIRMEPQIVEKIDSIVFMGGSMTRGNVTPAAEFNIYADAEAAHIVFSSGAPLVMIGLDVTREVRCFDSIVQHMRQYDNKASHLFVDLMVFFNKTQQEIFGWEGGPLHDPVTIAYLLDPTVLTLKKMYATVDYKSSDSYGRTNCDYFERSLEHKNVHVATAIDIDKFWRLIEQGILQYA